MEKLIYLLEKRANLGLEEFEDTLLYSAISDARKLGAAQMVVNVANLNEAVAETSPQRIIGEWSHLHAVVHFWLETVDDRKYIEPIFATLSERVHGYLVTESRPQNFQRKWMDGERRPGVTQFTTCAKPDNVSEDDFYFNWQVGHTQLSFALHPHRWSYVRNAVARSLTANAPPYRALVSEHFRDLTDFTDDSRYFGSSQVVEEMYRELPGFCAVESMLSGPMSEYAFD